MDCINWGEDMGFAQMDKDEGLAQEDRDLDELRQGGTKEEANQRRAEEVICYHYASFLLFLYDSYPKSY